MRATALRLNPPQPGDDGLIIPAIAPDGSYFPIGKMDAHRRGVRHLAVSVFVISGEEILLQRRADGKYHCAGLWANTCCSHPHWGETPAAGARRRLREEMGVCLDLSHANVIDYEADVTNGLRECERVHIFHAAADRTTLTVDPDPDEVAETRWSSLSAIRQQMHDAPGLFAPWFRIYVARWDELGLSGHAGENATRPGDGRATPPLGEAVCI